MFKIDQDWVICAIVKIQLTDHWNWIVVSSPIKTKLTSVLHPNKNQSRNGSVLHFSVSDRIRSVIYFCSPLHQSWICFNYLVRRLKNFSISVLIESSSLTFIVKRETFWHKWHPFRPTNLIHSFCCLTVRVKGWNTNGLSPPLRSSCSSHQAEAFVSFGTFLLRRKDISWSYY